MLFIGDDCCLDPKKLNTSRAFGELMKMGRNYLMTRFMAVQWVLDLKPGLREQFQVYVFPRTNTPATVDKIHAHYGGPIREKHVFNSVFLRLTKDYGCMVVVSNPQAERPSDSIFWTRAPKDGGEAFRKRQSEPCIIGRDAYWAMNAVFFSRSRIIADMHAITAPKGGPVVRMVGEQAAAAAAESVMCV